MKKLFRQGILALLCALPFISRAQISGADRYNSIDAGTYSTCGGSFADEESNDSSYGFGDDIGEPSDDIWYRFTLSNTAEVNISLCGSDFDTYLHLLDGNGNEFESNDDGGPLCSGVQSSIQITLSPGTYYIAAEGYDTNSGYLSMELGVVAISTPPGANMTNAIDAGTFSNSGSYSDTRDNGGACYGDDMGEYSPDIYYKFTLTGDANVSLSHCGSSIDTYMHLLDASGNEIAFNDDNSNSPCPGAQSYIQISLTAGTYYVVSEGYGSTTGTIITGISVASTTVAAPVISYSSPQTLSIGTAVSISPVNTGGAAEPGDPVTSTFAGSSQGFANGIGTAAKFNLPICIAVDASGNTYIGDTQNYMVRKITSNGTVSTFAGSGSSGSSDGTGSSASFSHPSGLAVDASGNIFVSDQYIHKIRKISPAGVVTTFAGSGTAGSVNGTGTAASFNNPLGLVFDGAGNLYVADYTNNKIRKITPAGVVTTFAGTGVAGATNGPGSSATFKGPMGLAIDSYGNIYVADRLNYLIRKITPAGIVSTFAGSGSPGSANGLGTSASFNRPTGVAVDASGNVFVTDEINYLIRKITPAGLVTTIAGSPSVSGTSDGVGSSARFYGPYALAMAGQGNLYVVDELNHRIRKIIAPPAYTISPALPAGLIFNDTDGTISGTPTAASPLTAYTITARNSGGISTTTLNLEVSGSCPLPSYDQNYIITYSPREAGQTSPSAVVAASCDKNKVQTHIEYFDGLGRPMQTVDVKGSGDGAKDVVIPNEYDQFGREARKFLPYASSSNNGSYKAAALSEVTAYYQSQPSGMAAAFNTPYAQTVFDGSPLNKVLEQGAPGNPWQPSSSGITGSGHTVKTDYGTNAASEVFNWNSAPGVHIVGIGASFLPGVLFKTVFKDENWVSGKTGTAEEFKDKIGRLRLKRKWESETKCQSTYYVYDNLGNLLYVLPPEVTETGQSAHNYYYESDSLFLKYIYAYHYDYRNRVIEKKIPGKGREYLIYNKMDQVVATQDAEQRKTGQWLVYKYDAMGRVVMTGLTTATRTAAQSGVDGQTSQWESRTGSGTGYSENCWPGSLSNILTINYYDDYNFPGNPFSGSNSAQSNMLQGLLTGTKVYRTDGTNPLYTTLYYDSKGREIQRKSQNHLGGTDVTDNTYNFTGQLTASTRIHTVNGQTTTIANNYSYDHMGRKLETTESINGVTPVILSRLSYNDTGQLTGKEVHSTDNGATFLNKTSYTYNPRGWLKSQANNYAGFSMTLAYEDGTYPQYNGNISSQNYTNGGNPNTFTYQYDRLNRLASAIATGMSEQLTYDDMGNIKSLNRDNGGAKAYSYSGNQLLSVAGVTSTVYQYDDNGNATTDGRNGKTISYNYLNLPQTISGGLSYTYDAAGRKLRKNNNGQLRDYVDGIEYNGTTIDIIHTEEGVARNNGGSYSYEYNLTDHLGNVRATFYRNPNTGNLEVLQRDDYYAFGKRKVVQGGVNKYLYNGKELQDELSSAGQDGEYDYGARFYDPVIGRFTTVDKLADHPKQINISPFAYTGNNPVNRIDPDGNCWPCLIALGEAALEAITVEQVATATVVTGGSLIIGNGIRNYSNINSSVAVQDNTTVVNSNLNIEKVKSPPNPNGAKGKPDHQEKVGELNKKAQSEAKPGEQVVTEKKIQGHDSNRRPDAQIIDKEGKTRKVFEAERKPNSQRNVKREEEYKKLGVEQETHKVGN